MLDHQRGTGGLTVDDRQQGNSSNASNPFRPFRRRAVRLGVALAAAIASAWAVCAAAPASAGVNVWTSAGPNGGSVVALVPDPVDPRVVYAATRLGGVWKSADGGASWRGASRGLADHSMLALTVDPAAPATLYAATFHAGVYLSRDGAASWTAVAPFGPGLEVDVSSLAADPNHPGTVYAGTQAGVWVSRDGGGSWVQAVVTDPSDTAVTVLLAADPLRSSTFAFVALPSFTPLVYSLFETADGGLTWSDRSASLPALPVGDVQLGFAIEPAAPGTLYIAATRTEVDTGRQIPKTYRSGDGGATWQGAGTGGFPLAAAAGGLVVSGGLRSANHGLTWTAIAQLPDTLESYAIAAGGAKIYAAGDSLGVLASTDGARSWQAANQGLGATPVLAFAVDPRTPGTLYAATGGLGLLKSRNSGQRWRPLATGQPPLATACCPPNFQATLAVDAAAPGTVFYEVGLGALAVSADAGATWARLPQESVVSMVPSPSSPDVLYAICDAPGCQLQGTTDGGNRWSCLAPEITFYEVVISPAAPATLYGLASYPGSHALYKSTDGGASWVPIDGALPLAPELTGPNGVRGHLAVDPTDAERLFVSGASGVWMTADGGSSWASKNRGLPRPGNAPLLAIDPENPALVYAAGGAIGVYRSANGGGRWQPILGGLPPLGAEFYTALAADPAHPGSVYLATIGNGLLTYTAH